MYKVTCYICNIILPHKTKIKSIITCPNCDSTFVFHAIKKQILYYNLTFNPKNFDPFTNFGQNSWSPYNRYTLEASKSLNFFIIRHTMDNSIGKDVYESEFITYDENTIPTFTRILKLICFI